MGKEDPSDIRKKSEADHQQLVQKIADRVWEMWKEQLRLDNERRGSGKRR